MCGIQQHHPPVKVIALYSIIHLPSWSVSKGGFELMTFRASAITSIFKQCYPAHVYDTR